MECTKCLFKWNEPRSEFLEECRMFTSSKIETFVLSRVQDQPVLMQTGVYLRMVVYVRGWGVRGGLQSVPTPPPPFWCTFSNSFALYKTVKNVVLEIILIPPPTSPPLTSFFFFFLSCTCTFTKNATTIGTLPVTSDKHPDKKNLQGFTPTISSSARTSLFFLMV